MMGDVKPKPLPAGLFEFAEVSHGYSKNQVDACLCDLGEQLARAEAEVAVLRDKVARMQPAGVRSPDLGPLAPEVVAVLADVQALRDQARCELDGARRKAGEIVGRAVEEAARARRDFEIALEKRRELEREAEHARTSAGRHAGRPAPIAHIIAEPSHNGHTPALTRRPLANEQ
jgi:hypothetical protein